MSDLEDDLWNKKRDKKKLDKFLPAALKFVKEQEQIKEYERMVIPYIKDCHEYLLQNKTIWNNRKDEILNLFHTYDDPIIAENFKNWFEGINEDMIKNQYSDERIVWLAHTVRMIQLNIRILKSIDDDTNEIHIDTYKCLGFEIPRYQQYQIEQEEEFKQECYDNDIKYWKTSQWGNYPQITVPISCDKDKGYRVHHLSISFPELRRPNNKYSFDINCFYYASNEVLLHYDSVDDSDDESYRIYGLDNDDSDDDNDDE